MAVNYRKAAKRAARKYGLDPTIFVRQIQQESGFDPTAKSGAGAIGIAQIMPQTAAGWGVDPRDPIASLDAAAKNMARYVERYGGYENALRAYNAGPGAIEASKGYSETNHYVATILRGKSPSTKGVNTTGGGGGERSDPRFSPGQAVNFAALLSSVREGSGRPQPGVTTPSAPAFSASAVMPEQSYDVPSPGSPQPQGEDPLTAALQAIAAAGNTQIPGLQTTGGGGGGGGGRGSGRVGGVSPGGTIHELFWNGPGATNIDNDKAVGKGFVSDHTDHVHLAADPKTMRQAVKLAGRLKLNVGEYGKGITSGHASGSYHYQPYGAMDVSGDVAAMRKFAKRIARAKGF